MASIAISASLQRACSSSHVTTKKQNPEARVARSLGTKQSSSNVVTLNVESQTKGSGLVEKPVHNVVTEAQINTPIEPESEGVRFKDDRWKKGTWDLNMFVKDGKIDWDDLIVSEAKRRKFLEIYPQASTNEDPVLFMTSIIPWWAWLKRSYLPEAELINGRAAMIGFFMAYVIDALTGLGMVGQTGNFVFKAGVFLTVFGVVFFRKAQDFDNLRKLATEATLYDKQWKSTWEDQDNKI